MRCFAAKEVVASASASQSRGHGFMFPSRLSKEMVKYVGKWLWSLLTREIRGSNPVIDKNLYRK